MEGRGGGRVLSRKAIGGLHTKQGILILHGLLVSVLMVRLMFFLLFSGFLLKTLFRCSTSLAPTPVILFAGPLLERGFFHFDSSKSHLPESHCA